jgi:hypothetical protein
VFERINYVEISFHRTGANCIHCRDQYMRNGWKGDQGRFDMINNLQDIASNILDLLICLQVCCDFMDYVNAGGNELRLYWVQFLTGQSYFSMSMRH